MASPQPGIFALGSQSHDWLEYDLALWAEPRDLVNMVAGLFAARSTVGNLNLVCGFRPELWAASNPGKAPRHANGFLRPIVGADGYTMPATQHDLVVWAAAGSTSAVFDSALSLTAALRPVVGLVDETTGWSYHDDLDLTGFIDGTENPPLVVAPTTVLVPDSAPGAGGSVMLLQKWEHDAEGWAKLPVTEQEQVIGRTKSGSVELAERPDTSHSARTDQDHFGHILRRNTPYGSVLGHGTMFVGFCAAQRPLHSMLESMAGVAGPRDALTMYARPLTGAFYFVPSIEDLAESH